MTTHNPAGPSGSAGGSALPRVGGVRCYWALLKPRYPVPEIPGSKLELVFIHPDPVLNAHLQKQSMSLTGRGVIEFIHPAEREQARHDLANAISSDDLQGSVTRVRFARLSRLRLILGCRPDEIEYFENHEKVVEDDDWMVLDLVLNWVADGLLLAFFHAIKDLDPVANNDPSRISEGWSNFCGTATMTDEMLESLYRDVSSAISPPPLNQFPPTRIFQLHTTPLAPYRPAELVFSWPPGRPPGVDARGDGLYEPADYADLMKQVDMDPSQLQRAPDEVRTTCTTRFGATHSVSSEGCYRMIQSVYIPYGSVIFCCFQTTRMFDLSPRSSEAAAAASYNMLPPQPSADWMSGAPPNGAPGPSMPMQVGGPPPAGMQMPILPPGAPMPPPPQGMPPLPDWRSNGQEYGTPMTQPPPTQGYYPDRFSPSGHPPQSGHPHPEMGYNNAGAGYEAAGSGSSPPTGGHQNNSSPANSTRPLVRPPGNVDCCQMCGIRESPEWRRSESGIKDLCNACGLRLARQVAKREGRQKPRKKKEKSE